MTWWRCSDCNSNSATRETTKRGQGIELQSSMQPSVSASMYEFQGRDGVSGTVDAKLRQAKARGGDRAWGWLKRGELYRRRPCADEPTTEPIRL